MRDKLRDRDKQSIRAFLQANADCLTGRVLDYGCGLRPYRDVVKDAGGDYHGYDRTHFPGSVCGVDFDPDVGGPFDAVICTQVIQYLPEPHFNLSHMHHVLRRDGVLLLTGPTNWPVVEDADLWRFTPFGVEVLLRRAGFRDIAVDPREVFAAERDERWMLGWQAKAVA